MFSTKIIPFDVGGTLHRRDGDGPSVDDKLPVLSLSWVIELAMDGIILEHVDHEVKFNEEVIDDNNIRVARVKSCPGDQALNVAKPTYPVLNHYVSDVAGTTQQEVAAC